MSLNSALIITSIVSIDKPTEVVAFVHNTEVYSE